MPAASTTLQLYLNSSFLADLMTSSTDGIQLVEEGYAPQVPRRITSPLGGLGTYQEVEEQITVNVYGSTAANCYANLAKLMRWADAAVVWQDTTPARITPISTNALVEIRYQPQGSTQAAPLRATVTNASVMPTLPQTYNDKQMVYTIENVQLTFTRRIWTGTGSTVVSSATAAPAAYSLNFGSSVTVLSPLWFQFKFSSGRATIPPSILAFTSEFSAVQFVDAASLSTGSAPWSSVADAANAATGNILRYTPSGTTAQTTTTANLTITGASSYGSKVVDVFATVRSSTTTTVWSVRALGYAVYGAASYASDYAVISGSTAAQVVQIGTVIVPAGIGKIALEVTASTASGTFDVDTLLVISRDDPTSAIVSIPEQDISAVGGTNIAFITNGEWHKNPDAMLWADGGNPLRMALSATGTLDLVTSGSTQGMAWLAVHGAGATSRWTPYDDGLTTATTGTLTAIRTPAYLAPE